MMGTRIKLMIKGRCQGDNSAKTGFNRKGIKEINGKINSQMSKATFHRLGVICGEFCMGMKTGLQKK